MKFLFCLVTCMKGMAQPYHLQSETAYISAGAYSTHLNDVFSFICNPASLGNTEGFSCGILAERKWMLKELDNYVMAFSGNLGRGGLGVLFQQSGDANYNEQSLELAYGKNIGKVEIGIRFNYLRDKVPGYPGIGFGSTGISMRFHVSKKLITGWEIGIPVFGKAGEMNPEKDPQLFKTGFGYEYTENLLLAIQIVKVTGLPLNVIPSIEYHYDEHFFFSFGINSNSGSPFFKSGWKKNKLSIEIYTVYETVLGFSPGLMLIWENKKKKE
ncbi:MAG TPA: hypothetical protein VK711_10355 [Puia sp.]|nr:hypothetical protein [Puia sp.]